MRKGYTFLLFFLFSSFVFTIHPQEPVETGTKEQEQSINAHRFLQDEPIIENKNSSNFMAEFVNMLMTLLLVVVVLLIISWVLKKMLHTRAQQENNNSTIKVLERRVLNPKVAIYLLEVMGQGIVIAEFPNGITRLAEFPLTDEMQAQVANNFDPNPTETAFQKILKGKS